MLASHSAIEPLELLRMEKPALLIFFDIPLTIYMRSENRRDQKFVLAQTWIRTTILKTEA